MKNKIKYITVLFLMALGFSCTDESTYPIDFDLVNNSNAGILSQITTPTTSVTFDKTDIPNARYEVVLQANDRDRGKLFTKVELFVSFIDRTPGNGTNNKAEVLMQTYQASEFVADPTTGLPRITINKTAIETIALLGLDVVTEVDGSDQFFFRHAMHFPDGNIYTSTNVNTAISALGGVYKSPFGNIVAVVCPSDLGGMIDYVSTITLGGAGSAGSGTATGCVEPIVGTTEWTVTGPGIYEIGDASFGVWNMDCLAYGNSVGNTLSDACNVLAISGTDQYGDSYTWTNLVVSPDGLTLSFDWGNTWGDGGHVVLTRPGKTWPLGLTF